MRLVREGNRASLPAGLLVGLIDLGKAVGFKPIAPSLANLMVNADFIPQGAAACGVIQRGRTAHLTVEKELQRP